LRSTFFFPFSRASSFFRVVSICPSRAYARFGEKVSAVQRAFLLCPSLDLYFVTLGVSPLDRKGLLVRSQSRLRFYFDSLALSPISIFFPAPFFRDFLAFVSHGYVRITPNPASPDIGDDLADLLFSSPVFFFFFFFFDLFPFGFSRFALELSSHGPSLFSLSVSYCCQTVLKILRSFHPFART